MFMTRRPGMLARIAALLAAGAFLTQTSSCVFDTLGDIVGTVALTYLYDAVNIIFRNVLNV